MRIRQDWVDVHRAAGAMLGMMLMGSWVPTAAMANTVFTWDPAAASPALGEAGSAFTADTIDGIDYLRDIGPIANPSPVIYPVSFIEQITGFTLHGVPVATPGLNGTPAAAGSYGLYLTMQWQTQAIGPPNTYRYLSGQVALMADPGNNDGAVSSTTAGLLFANGTAGDITLATGSLVSGHFEFSKITGIRNVSHFVETFEPAAGEGDFFVTPVSPDEMIEEVLTVPTPAFTIAPYPSDPTLQYGLLNGGIAVIGLTVPEPASFLLLGSGLIGLAALRRHARNCRLR